LLKVDRLTSIHSRGKFARICVEIDIQKKLVPKVKVMGEVLNLEYEGLHQVCFRCGVYGHKKEFCHEPTVHVMEDQENQKIANQDPVVVHDSPVLTPVVGVDATLPVTPVASEAVAVPT